MVLTRVIFAKGTTTFRIEALTLEILLAHLIRQQKRQTLDINLKIIPHRVTEAINLNTLTEIMKFCKMNENEANKKS